VENDLPYGVSSRERAGGRRGGVDSLEDGIERRPVPGLSGHRLSQEMREAIDLIHRGRVYIEREPVKTFGA
jgi:hypothetical protein